MMRYTYECKQDKHATWTPISVTTKHPMADYELEQYAWQWAMTNCINPDTVSIRCLNMDGQEVVIRLSNATVNKGLRCVRINNGCTAPTTI